MNIYKYITLIFSCACSFMLHAQETYLWLGVHGNDVGFPYEYHMYDYDIHTGDTQLLFAIDSSELYHDDLNGRSMEIMSFEFSPDRQSILLLEREGDLYSYDIALGVVSYIQDITPENTDYLWYGYTATTSITKLNDSLYYASGNTLGIYNYSTSVYNKTCQPPDLITGQTDPQWDLKTHRKVVNHKGRWITLDGDVIPRFINPYDPEDHELALNIDLTPYGHFNSPLISYTYDCDNTELYILDKRGHTFARDSVEIDRLNLEEGTIERAYTHLGLFPDDAPSYSVYEVKHYNNPTWTDCQRKIDLDEDDSTIVDYDYYTDTSCVFVNLPLSDRDIKITNELAIDSIVLKMWDPFMSFVYDIPVGNYNLTKYSTPTDIEKIVIENNGTTSITDFEQAILDGRLTNTGGDNFTELHFNIWQGGIEGENAKAIYRFFETHPMAGDDVQRVFCEGDPVLNIDNILAPNAESGGLFYDYDFQNISELPTYQAPISDTIYYIVTNGACYDTATIVNTINPNPVILPIEDFIICPDESVTIDLSSYTEQIEWSDEELDVIRMIDVEGEYIYELQNEYGCTSEDTFSVMILPDAVMQPVEAKVCQGEVFSFIDVDYTMAGAYSDTLTNTLGCDSLIYNIDFDFYEDVPFEIDGNLGICDEESTQLVIVSNHDDITLDNVAVETESILIDQSGIYQVTGYDENGCYHEQEIEVVSMRVVLYLIRGILLQGWIVMIVRCLI